MSFIDVSASNSDKFIDAMRRRGGLGPAAPACAATSSLLANPFRYFNARQNGVMGDSGSCQAPVRRSRTQVSAAELSAFRVVFDH